MADDNTLLFLAAVGVGAFFLFPKQIGAALPAAADSFVKGSYDAGKTFGGQVREDYIEPVLYAKDEINSSIRQVIRTSAPITDTTTWTEQYPGNSQDIFGAFKVGWNISPLGGLWAMR